MRTPRIIAVAGLLAAVLLAVPALAAPPKVEITAPLLQFARPGAWIPVHVDISSTDALDVIVYAEFDGTDGIRGATRNLAVPKNSTRRAVVSVPVPDWGSALTVTVRTKRGQPLQAKTLPVRAGMNPASLHVAVIGDEPLGWPLVREITGMPVPGHADVADDTFRSVSVQNLLAPDVPDHWFGWSSVDLLVWRRPDPANITPEQQSALRGWLASGGTAVIALGDNHANWTSSPMGDLVPLHSGSVIRSERALGELWALAGSGLPPGVSKSNPGEEATGERGLPIVDVVPHTGAEVAWADADGQPLVVTARPGTGKVVLLTFDPAAGELKGGFDREKFWRSLLGLWEPASTEATTWDPYGDPVPSTAHYRAGVAGMPVELPEGPCVALGEAAAAIAPDSLWEDSSQRTHSIAIGVASTAQAWWSGLSNAIGNFSAAAPLSLAFILVFGALYLLCIGPLDYFVLRRIGRPMFTWVTFPILAIGFSVGAGVVIKAQKAGDSETHCLALVDYMPSAGVARGTSWCSMWASRKTDVITSVPRGNGWVLPARHSDYDDGNEYYYGYEPAITGENIRMLVEPGHANLAFEAAQWSASNVRGQWMDDEKGSVDWYVGDDGATSVRNELGVDLVDAWIVDGENWYRVGDLPAGAARVATARGTQGPEVAELQDPAHIPIFVWAFEPLESRAGHLHLGNPGRPVLLGFTRDAIGQPEFDGLGAVDKSVTMVRVQLTAPESLAESPTDPADQETP